MSRSALALAIAGAVAVVVATACSLVISTSGLSGGEIDAGAEANTPKDAGTESATTDAGAPSCDPTKPFGPLTSLGADVNTASNELAGVMSTDGLRLYVARMTGTNDAALFLFTRSATTDTFGSGRELKELSSPVLESDPFITADELTIYFDSNRPSSQKGEGLWMATRSTLSDPFGMLQLVDGVQSDSEELEPWLDPTGTRIYFASNRAGTFDLYASSRGMDGIFSLPVLVDAVSDSMHNDESPILTADELTLYFASDRPGGAGGNDVWITTRATKTAPFGTPTRVEALSTPKNDYPTWLSSDGCRMITESYVTGNADLFIAERGK